MKDLPQRTFYFLMLFSILIYSSTYAQVGIGNSNPKSIIDISASNPAIPTAIDGILIPRVNSLYASPGADQDGMMVFLTTEDTFYFWENDSTSWITLFSENNQNHYVGELYGGGIVFYIYDNGEHGLIASLDNLDAGTGITWGLHGTNVDNSESSWEGDVNSLSIENAGGSSNDAAGLCTEYSNDGYSDWYLPSVMELQLLYFSSFAINNILENDGDINTTGLDITPIFNNVNNDYWSSTEEDDDDAYVYKFQNGHFDKKDKNSEYKVRAVRAF